MSKETRRLVKSKGWDLANIVGSCFLWSNRRLSDDSLDVGRRTSDVVGRDGFVIGINGMFLNSFRPKQPLEVKNNLHDCPCLQCAIVNRLSQYYVICDTDMTLEHCHCLQDPSCTSSCSEKNRAPLPSCSEKNRAPLPGLIFVLRVRLSFCCPLNFFFLQLATRACLCYPFLFAAPINDTTANWFSFQESGGPVSHGWAKIKVKVSSLWVYEPALSLAQWFLSLLFCIHLHSSASLGQFCPCCSASTCTAQPVWVSSVPVALHPPARFAPLGKWEPKKFQSQFKKNVW